MACNVVCLILQMQCLVTCSVQWSSHGSHGISWQRPSEPGDESEVATRKSGVNLIVTSFHDVRDSKVYNQQIQTGHFRVPRNLSPTLKSLESLD